MAFETELEVASNSRVVLHNEHGGQRDLVSPAHVREPTRRWVPLLTALPELG